MVLIRGTVEKRAQEDSSERSPQSESPDAAAYSALIFASFMIPLVWLGQLDSLAEFSRKPSRSGMGYIHCTSNLLHAYFRSEGWRSGLSSNR